MSSQAGACSQVSQSKAAGLTLQRHPQTPGPGCRNAHHVPSPPKLKPRLPWRQQALSASSPSVSLARQFPAKVLAELFLRLATNLPGLQEQRLLDYLSAFELSEVLPKSLLPGLSLGEPAGACRQLSKGREVETETQAGVR